MAEEVGQVGLRREVVDKTIKGFAVQNYKFKQALTENTTGGWDNTFYTEDSSVLSTPRGTKVKGIPRGANFPQASVNWTKQTKALEKYGIEDNIFWEDILTNNIDVQGRTMFRLAEKVTKQVDDEIFDTLTQGLVPTTIGSVMIGAGSSWNGANPNILDNLMEAKEKMSNFNYDTSNAMAFISPKDHRSMVSYLSNKGAQFPQISEGVTMNGNIGKLAGVNLIQSNSVTANYALMVVPKVVGTWKAAVPLRTEVIVDPMKSVKIRCAEIGVTQLTDPQASVLISGTQV